MKHAISLLALAAAVAVPTAFAQTTPTADPAAQPQAAPAPTAQPKQVTWADLDTDKDGSLTKAEVATVPVLTQSFDAADADADGKLTADEYKAHAAQGDATEGGAADTGAEPEEGDTQQ